MIVVKSTKTGKVVIEGTLIQVSKALNINRTTLMDYVYRRVKTDKYTFGPNDDQHRSQAWEKWFAKEWDETVEKLRGRYDTRRDKTATKK